MLSVSNPVMRLTRVGDDAKPQGRRILITVAIHGNEQCGLVAVNQLLSSGELSVSTACRGEVSEVVFVLGNPRAVEADVRFCNENLNRIFMEGADVVEVDSKIYERTLTPGIADEIDKASWYMDIHSTSASSPSFCIPASSGTSSKVAECLPVEFVLEELINSLQGTTLHWAMRDKTKVAMVVECGQHKDPASVTTAKRVILQFLSLASKKKVGDPTSQEKSNKRILVCRERQELRSGFHFINCGKTPHAFQRVGYKELIAKDDFGDIICHYPEGAYLIMPTAHYVIGEEAWFWGVEAEDADENKSYQFQSPKKVGSL
uniref:Succinylglutamate desuccinylase/Aspartoacylase catalytic domain-containing protein n=1 Tax=Aplanochytrium stocchinoi TaxID=215587 RepID=A0A6S8FQB2_9STRA|mmetsp:Transcript_1380/g.1775  ORF Transcript_1380/g.1775 Transcript_1380/m.1775 type:complete len:318 (-) Transcript_1380:882-1835(-)